ncbi:NINJ1-like protein, partial [Mya arenaria]
DRENPCQNLLSAGNMGQQMQNWPTAAKTDQNGQQVSNFRSLTYNRSQSLGSLSGNGSEHFQNMTSNVKEPQQNRDKRTNSQPNEVPKEKKEKKSITTKTFAHGMMDVSLLTSNATQLRAVLSNPEHDFYRFLLILIGLSITLQIISGVLLVVSDFYKTQVKEKDRQNQRKRKTLSFISLAMVMIVTALNILISTFYTPDMEKAMKQAKLAEKESRRAFKLGKDIPEGVNYTTGTDGKGIKIIHQTHNYPGTVVHIESAKNIQVGSHNNIVINQRRSGRSSRHRAGSSSSDEDEYRGRGGAEGGVKGEEESEREMTPADVSTVSEFVGKDWRRFLRNLGLEDEAIEALRHDHHVDGLRQILYEGVMTWKKRRGRVTLGELGRVLQKTGQYSALSRLRE